MGVRHLEYVVKIEWGETTYSQHDAFVWCKIDEEPVINLRLNSPNLWYIPRSEGVKKLTAKVVKEDLPPGIEWNSKEAKDLAFAIWSMS